MIELKQALVGTSYEGVVSLLSRHFKEVGAVDLNTLNLAARVGNIANIDIFEVIRMVRTYYTKPQEIPQETPLVGPQELPLIIPKEGPLTIFQAIPTRQPFTVKELEQIPGIGYNTAIKMIEDGLVTPQAIIKAGLSVIMKYRGITLKKANLIIQEMTRRL